MESGAWEIYKLGYPLLKIDSIVDYLSAAYKVDRAASRVTSGKAVLPDFLTETKGRGLVLKLLQNLWDEPVEAKIVVRLSFQNFFGLTVMDNSLYRKAMQNF